MNWQQWSETQAGQILELRRLVKKLRKRVWLLERRLELHDLRRDRDRERWYGR